MPEWGMFCKWLCYLYLRAKLVMGAVLIVRRVAFLQHGMWTENMDVPMQDTPNGVS